jgi:hypothetical protein
MLSQEVDDIPDELLSIIRDYCITNDGIKGGFPNIKSAEQWHTDYKSQGCGYCGYAICLMLHNVIVIIYNYNMEDYSDAEKKVTFCYGDDCLSNFNAIWEIQEWNESMSDDGGFGTYSNFDDISENQEWFDISEN